MICNTQHAKTYDTSSARLDQAHHRRHNKHAVVTPQYCTYINGHHIIPSQLTRMYDSGHAQLPRPSRPSIRASRDSPSANQPSRITSPRITAIRHHQPHIRPPSAFHVLQAGLASSAITTPALSPASTVSGVHHCAAAREYCRGAFARIFSPSFLFRSASSCPLEASRSLSTPLEASPRLHASLPG